MVARGALGDLLDEAGLAHARLADHDDGRGAAAAHGGVDDAVEERELVVAADERHVDAAGAPARRDDRLLGDPRLDRLLAALGDEGAERSCSGRPSAVAA